MRYVSIFIILGANTFKVSKGHGHLTFPLPRGALAGGDMARYSQPVDKNAPRDHTMHFPAGDKGYGAGAGARSQRNLAKNWTPFDPLSRNFQWRAGICGDLINRQGDHRRGGKYYYGGKISATFRQGAVVSFQASIVGHHNGFFQFYICDVKRCDDEISQDCFRKGACFRLKRANNYFCDEKPNRWCGPVDRKHPERWYLPCPGRANHGGFDTYGRDGQMKYVLPKFLRCNHCVLHWSYNAANTCNPPGLADYFTGDDKPKWGKCKGQSGAVGGYASWAPTCGGDRFSEEYYNCADVRIV